MSHVFNKKRRNIDFHYSIYINKIWELIFINFLMHIKKEMNNLIKLYIKISNNNLNKFN